jgi:hypothetical protein
MFTVYRVQDADGRGPWKPGFSKVWVEDRPEAEYARLKPWPLELGPVHHNALYGAHTGCGCTSLEQLRLWFLPVEYRRLLHYGYQAVQLSAGRILGESEIQCVFERAAPLNQDVKVIELYPADEVPA